jgi:hypothetical protein
MSLATKRAVFPEAFKPKKLSEIKDKDEKRWKIEGAVSTLKRKSGVEREIAEIKMDKPLFDAAQAMIDQEIADLAVAKTT